MSMNDNLYNHLILILKDFSLVLGIVLFIISLVVGVLLVLKPDMIIRLNKSGSSSFSFRSLINALDMPNYVDHVFYRHHRIVGVIVTFISAYMLYYFTQVYDASVISGLVAGSKYTGIVEIFAHAVQLFLLLTGMATFVIGIIVFIRPSIMKGFEGWCNHWISTRPTASSLSIERDQVNQLVYKYPRSVGIIIIILSIYAVIGLILLYI